MKAKELLDSVTTVAEVMQEYNLSKSSVFFAIHSNAIRYSKKGRNYILLVEDVKLRWSYRKEIK